MSDSKTLQECILFLFATNIMTVDTQFSIREIGFCQILQLQFLLRVLVTLRKRTIQIRGGYQATLEKLRFVQNQLKVKDVATYIKTREKAGKEYEKAFVAPN
jgi:hypothetical protein